MAKVIHSSATDTYHLHNGEGRVLCDPDRECTSSLVDGTLTCSSCAKIALAAIELSTKAERREWRKL